MLLRIGEKIINRQKINQIIDEMLNLRSQGFSQQEVANRVGIDRTVISKLETLGEVRKGGRVALVGFPIENREELRLDKKALIIPYYSPSKNAGILYRRKVGLVFLMQLWRLYPRCAIMTLSSY